MQAVCLFRDHVCDSDAIGSKNAHFITTIPISCTRTPISCYLDARWTAKSAHAIATRAVYQPMVLVPYALVGLGYTYIGPRTSGWMCAGSLYQDLTEAYLKPKETPLRTKDRDGLAPKL